MKTKPAHISVKEEYCVGCGLCEVHCLVRHSKSKDVIKAYKKEFPQPVSRIRVDRSGDVSLAVSCRHCDEPDCVYACLTGAMRKNPATGQVYVNTDKCIGCWTCLVVCPNGGVKRNLNKTVKCDLCEGTGEPACVANCPNGALVLDYEETS